ncbi:MAG: carbon-nitrogen hydrolase family protein [Isosphaeraceae bacterium]
MRCLGRSTLVAIALFCVNGENGASLVAGEPPSPVIASRSDQPPRKVVVGTTIFHPSRPYPGRAARVRQLEALVDSMAAKAERQYPGEGLDLAVLTESALTSTAGKATERATTLDSELTEALGDLARKHKTYLVAPLDLHETRDGATIQSNAAVLFDREGRVAGIYRKAHPVAVVGTDELESGITPGREFPVFDCDFGKLGIQICWDMQFDDGWEALARGGAELVVWPTASPAKTMPASRAVRNRFYVVSSTWRDNATIYEPTGLVAARIQSPESVLVHRVDLSYAVLGWSAFLKNGEALREKFGDRVDFHYEPAEDVGLFWSNDPNMTIGAMVRSIGGEELDRQVERNKRLHENAGKRGEATATSPGLKSP